ncbi:hypothetical protein BKA70DRAFT_1291227 [Coprinopsis sp. MPI-PUGE-AT-0042]|nr:hypothetical protein BKA70DRAFT_1291227 [Coprinopsis sp. MPI-PUGE-AT-0042]
MLQQLPRELLETIVDILHTHGEYQFRRYSLVNRELGTLCQQRIFAHINNPSEFCKAKDPPLNSRLDPFKRLRQILFQNPRLRPYVRSLSLAYSVTDTPDGERRSISKEEYDVLGLLDNVEKLTFGFANSSRQDIASWSGDAFRGLHDAMMSFAQRNPVEMLIIFGIKDMPSSLLRQFRQLNSLSAFVVPISPSSLQGNAKLGTEYAPTGLQQRPPPICLGKLNLSGEETDSFAENFILCPSPLFDVSQVNQITLDSQHLLPCILPLLATPETIQIILETTDPDFTWLEGRLFSQLTPSSLSTLRKIVLLLLDESRRTNYLPFGGFVSELATAIESLVMLEEIDVRVGVAHRTGFILAPEWMGLEQVLERSHRMGVLSPRLRVLHIQVRHRILLHDFDHLDEPKHEARSKWKALFREGYVWCRDNLAFTTSIYLSYGRTYPV